MRYNKIASRGNVADTGITDRVNDIINDRSGVMGKNPTDVTTSGTN
ncbi:polymorphic toxin type 34 domain-containing protein [Escherichia coli]